MAKLIAGVVFLLFLLFVSSALAYVTGERPGYARAGFFNWFPALFVGGGGNLARP